MHTFVSYTVKVFTAAVPTYAHLCCAACGISFSKSDMRSMYHTVAVTAVFSPGFLEGVYSGMGMAHESGMWAWHNGIVCQNFEIKIYAGLGVGFRIIPL